MSLWGTLKIAVFGRSSATNELSTWRRDAIRENGEHSFLSGKVKNNQVHHGFHVSGWPAFALSRWNDWVMTEEEHNAYHSWERARFRHPLTRHFIAKTPLGLLFWAYFVRHWWKGWCVLGVITYLLAEYWV